MEQGRSEVEFDEFEKLLGEIPKMTSGNNSSRVPLCVNSCKAQFSRILNKESDDGGMQRTRIEQSPFKKAELEEANLPDERTFTSAFAEAGVDFGGNLRETTVSMPENSRLLFVPSCHSPNSLPCVFDKFDARKHDPQVFRRLQQVGYFQNYPSSVSPVHTVQGVQFCRTMQIPGLEFNVLSDHPQYMPPSQPLPHYLPLNQSHMGWRNIEEGQLQRLKLPEEPYLRMSPHFLYLYNQSMDAPSKLMSPRQEYFGSLDSRQADLTNGDLFLDKNEGVKGLDAMRRTGYPDKMLTRSQFGLNSDKAMKYGIRDESHNNMKHDERLWLHNQVDDSLPWDFFSTLNLKNGNLRMQPQKYNSLAEARGKIYCMAKDQHGCRFLQRKFSEKNIEDIEMIFCEIINHIAELMTDPFGNYLVQKLLEVCNEDQRMQIVHSVTRKPGELVKISCDMHGTRAVQKIIETVKLAEQIAVVLSALKPGIVTLIKNVNGNHVAQRCLQYLLPHCGKLIFEAAITHCVELATDRHGCCVLQKCLGHSEGEHRHLLVSEVASNALLLSQDPFGNYVLQFVFELQLQWAVLEILEQLEGNYTDLSMQKCSSNVVEKCLKQADDEHRAHIIREFINDGRLDQVMQDPYGNYVIQAALKQSRGALHAILVDAIKPHIPCLRTNPYGKKVLSALSLKK
ncbi:PREDICTED: pumilio homolog 12 [Tarenaya hassleriana]|uniref:pumilio homolog 12 n=1 Tax=Tarenaya hassleriana TaxID=28532 RepID=UPI00053CA48B|nr:PREDICTED: pumilio homolog 12 [Tarenaya hassleriana]XP_010536831.1 PREDICTED: pumilio homolog 12 [Tarenaya hassleriana]XP_019057875.1 PREDICTED: pumilio homolog 12 [Tarenaya hassleriana]